MKRLEPGCLALVIGGTYWPELAGETVTCIRRADERDPLALPGSWVIAGQPGHPTYCLERYLMRIDGGTEVALHETKGASA